MKPSRCSGFSFLSRCRAAELSLLVLLWLAVSVFRQDLSAHFSTSTSRIYGTEDRRGNFLFSYGGDIREYRSRWRVRDVSAAKASSNGLNGAIKTTVLKNAVEAYKERKISGWMDMAEIYALFKMRSVQLEHGVDGNVAEIGVHHGLFLSFLTAFAAEDDKTVAIDLFESLQSFNYDDSGKGSLQSVTENLKSLGFNLDNFVNITINSMNLSPETLEEKHLVPFRMFSVDGGHSFETTMNDILIAAKVLHPLGVIAVDDALGVTAGWSGVTDALFAFVNSQTEVVPFFLSRKKMYLCFRDAHKYYYSAFIDDTFFTCGRESDKSRRSIGAASGFPTEVCYYPWMDNFPPNFMELVEKKLADLSTTTTNS